MRVFQVFFELKFSWVWVLRVKTHRVFEFWVALSGTNRYVFLDSLVFYCQFAKSEMSKTESCQASQFVHLEVRIIDTMKIEILEKKIYILRSKTYTYWNISPCKLHDYDIYLFSLGNTLQTNHFSQIIWAIEFGHPVFKGVFISPVL